MSKRDFDFGGFLSRGVSSAKKAGRTIKRKIKNAPSRDKHGITAMGVLRSFGNKRR